MTDDDFKKVDEHAHEEKPDDDLKNYNAAMRKLKIVSFVSIFFIAA